MLKAAQVGMGLGVVTINSFLETLNLKDQRDVMWAVVIVVQLKTFNSFDQDGASRTGEKQTLIPKTFRR